MARCQPIPFVPASLIADLYSARHLTDEVVPLTLRLVFKHAKELAMTGDPVRDAFMDGAALIYEKAVTTVRMLKGSHSSPSYGYYCRACLTRLAVADSLTHLAGHNFQIAKALGHLGYTLEDNGEVRDAIARNAYVPPTPPQGT